MHLITNLSERTLWQYCLIKQLCCPVQQQISGFVTKVIQRANRHLHSTDHGSHWFAAGLDSTVDVFKLIQYSNSTYWKFKLAKKLRGANTLLPQPKSWEDLSPPVPVVVAPMGGTISRQTCDSFAGRRIIQTTASLSAPPAADSYDLPASKHMYYNVPLHVWEMGLLLLQDSDCGRVSQQNCDNLTLSLGQFHRTLNTHLCCWWLRRLVTLWRRVLIYFYVLT